MSYQRIGPWTTIVPIDNLGLTNDLFLVNKKLFVKKSKSICHRFLNLKGQISVARLLQSVPYTIPIINIKFQDGFLWTILPFYFDLIPLSKIKLSISTLNELANLVKQLHAEPINSTLPIWDPIKQLTTYCHLVHHDDKNLKNIENKLFLWLTSYQPTNLVLCHNDLSPNNFVINEKTWYLIDWDFAAVNDHWFDVASFVSETLKTEQEINEWYRLFAVTSDSHEIIRHWIIYQNLIWYYWARFLFEKTDDLRYQAIMKSKWLALQTEF